MRQQAPKKFGSYTPIYTLSYTKRLEYSVHKGSKNWVVEIHGSQSTYGHLTTNIQHKCRYTTSPFCSLNAGYSHVTSKIPQKILLLLTLESAGDLGRQRPQLLTVGSAVVLGRPRHNSTVTDCGVCSWPWQTKTTITDCGICRWPWKTTTTIIDCGVCSWPWQTKTQFYCYWLWSPQLTLADQDHNSTVTDCGVCSWSWQTKTQFYCYWLWSMQLTLADQHHNSPLNDCGVCSWPWQTKTTILLLLTVESAVDLGRPRPQFYCYWLWSMQLTLADQHHNSPLNDCGVCSWLGRPRPQFSS